MRASCCANGALASLAATLGSHKEISRLRFCFEHVTFESSQSPYSPGDDPWEITPASDAAAARIAEGLRDWTFVPSRFNGLMARYHAALETGAELPVTLADARQSLELVTACCMRRKRRARRSADRRVAPEVLGLAARRGAPTADPTMDRTRRHAASSRWAMRLRMATSWVCRRFRSRKDDGKLAARSGQLDRRVSARLPPGYRPTPEAERAGLPRP